MNLRSIAAMILAIGALLVVWDAWQAANSMLRSRDAGSVLAAPGAADVKPVANATPVLVELFTSEGCSSCPPADALLSRLERTQPVGGADAIVLEEHVDYWDRLGWKDPFSSSAMSERQTEYGKAFGGRQIYTPQMIVDGRSEFVGNSENAALQAIRTAGAVAKPGVTLAWAADGKLNVQIAPLANASAGDAPLVFLAITENDLRSDVKHGENAGRSLEHRGVVRQLANVAKADTSAPGFSSAFGVRTAPEWNRSNLRAVVFVQEQRSHRILAAAAIPFPA
jgi:hypothetical protein